MQKKSIFHDITSKIYYERLISKQNLVNILLVSTIIERVDYFTPRDPGLSFAQTH